MGRPRKTSTRDLHRRIIRRRGDACALCHNPIDYTLPHLHPMEFVVDHIIPWSKGGPDTLENKQAAHRTCNRQKSDRIGDIPPPRPTVKPITTERSW